MTENLVAEALRGDRRALARLLSLVENGGLAAQEVMRLLYPRSGRAHVVGITGAAGSGKSTLIFSLARALRSQGLKVGIVAVDPTSPFSKGALLGDRIRMQGLTSDAGVFIRSMASRGAIGGLAPATMDVITVMDAVGKDVIIVETVGAGQDEVEVMDAAHTVVVVTVPGAGDEIQAIKAGIFEIAHILVVNKADLPRADILARQLAEFVNLDKPDGWHVPVLQTVAIRDDGVDELVAALQSHREHLLQSGQLDKLRQGQAQHRLMAALKEQLWDMVYQACQETDAWEEAVRTIAERRADPITVAKGLIARALSLKAV